MRNAVESVQTMLAQQVEQALRELGEERELIKLHLQSSGTTPQQWAELEHRACIAVLVGRKPTPAARKTVDGAVAAMRAFRAGLLAN
jgi:hypothetical protein